MDKEMYHDVSWHPEVTNAEELDAEEFDQYLCYALRSYISEEVVKVFGGDLMTAFEAQTGVDANHVLTYSDIAEHYLSSNGEWVLEEGSDTLDGI